MSTLSKTSQQAVNFISQPSRRRPLFVLAILCLFAGSLWAFRSRSSAASARSPSRPSQAAPAQNHGEAWDFERDKLNFRFTEDQCDAAFPGLFDELAKSVADRNGKAITLDEIDTIPRQNGYVRGIIYDQELYINATEGGIYSRHLAVLLALHRAIITSPHPLPNIEFTFSSDDKLPPQAQWAFAKEPSDRHTWLMPDFGFWSWPETKVGSFSEVQRKAVEMEESRNNPTGRAWSWTEKVPKVLWRGATMGLPLREELVRATADQPWADVQALDWHDKGSMGKDLKSMAEHCQYRYLAHTEGNSYSGRLKYLQNCRSVIVAHPLEWVQHFSPLLSAREGGAGQNYVEVRRDFADLGAAVAALERDLIRARQIADNSVRVFRERYLTPAAEACYWRRLIKRWAEVSFEPSFYRDTPEGKKWRGVPLESYVLERRLEWDPY